MTIINRQWQSVPGASEVLIYPYLRKPDILSSNAFLLATSEQIALIDPGALVEQVEELLSLIRRLLEEKPRPLLIYLTHCHIDHALEASRFYLLRKTIPVWIAVHHDGVAALASGDAQKTIAELYNLEFPGFHPDIPLLPPSSRTSLHSRTIPLPDGSCIAVQTAQLPSPGMAPFFRKLLPLGDGQSLAWYPTPGHSPDSVCIRVGTLLFIGDILTAINPLVAGISGWNREDFLNTANHLIWLLDNTDIAWCCPGHGGVVAAPMVAELLRKMLPRAARLKDVEAMDARRLRATTGYALEILEEAEEVFTAIAGRLYYLAYHLENMGEEQLAQGYRQLLEADTIDACLRDLHLFAEDLQAGEKLAVEFAHRALGVIQKIHKLFDQEKLGGVIPVHLTTRARLLLLDFINAAKGVRNREDSVATDLNALIKDTIKELRKSPHDDQTILDAAADERQFLAALAARVAYVPLFEDIRVAFTPQESLPLAHIAAARFVDTLTDFLSLLAGRDIRDISLSTSRADNAVELQIHCPQKDILDRIGTAKEKVFARRFGACGLDLSLRKDRLHLRTRA
jgi:glyoxylase-like metal-dependent hydrolase (beta-lactamase superfamily II)